MTKQSVNNKTTAIIDIGSNSVRIMIISGGNVLFRQTITTQLSRDMKDGKLSYESVNRTFDGLSELCAHAKEMGCTDYYAFATAAVRKAVDGEQFCLEFERRFGFKPDVVSGDTEAELGLLGVFDGADGAIIDIGGASSEISVACGGKLVYTKSLDIGAVTLTGQVGDDGDAAMQTCLAKVKEYGVVPKIETLCAIGGTANTLGFIASGIPEYDREKSDGCVLSVDKLKEIIGEFYSMNADERAARFNINPLRAKVIQSGATMLLCVAEYVGVKQLVLRECDNLEGYYRFKVEDKHYER